jgi:hypothetical protein
VRACVRVCVCCMSMVGGSVCGSVQRRPPINQAFRDGVFCCWILCVVFVVFLFPPRIYACACSSVSSRSGSADVLEELGVPMLLPDGILGCIDQADIAFMFAPNFHPAMKHVVPVRSPTCFARPFLPPFSPSSMVHCGRGPLFGLVFVCYPRCARPWVFARFLISLVLY